MRQAADHFWPALSTLGLWLATTPAYALETTPLAGEAARVDVTESSSILYNFDNRNARAGSVTSELDDQWGTWYNRLNTNASWGAFQANVRLDSAWFFTSRSPTDVALALLRAEHGGALPANYSVDDAQFFVQKFMQAGTELSTRAVSWIYPAKYSISYAHPNLEVALGDNYAQFGRGFVLNLRKQDELASDTTLRGLRVTARGKLDKTRLKLTALAGATNPLRVDEASGRYLGTTPAVTSGILTATEAGMPRATDNDFVPEARPNFVPDRLLGAELEGRTSDLVVGLAGAHLQRGCVPSPVGCRGLASDPARAAARIDNASLALELPKLPGAGALYLELAHQWRAAAPLDGIPADTGYALYGSVNLNPKPVTLTAEFKHTRSFFPLAANIDVTRAREFTPIQYSAAPTTEAIWNDTEFEHFASCVSGGKAKADVEVSATTSLFVWVGRYNTWGELASQCAPSEATLNRIWDIAQGVQATSRDHSRSINTTLGMRVDTAARAFVTASGGSSDVYYRELYLRYDWVQRLPHDLSLQFSGWHRRRHQGLGGPASPWLQGTTENGLHVGQAWAFVFGFEYDQNPAFPGTYLNAQVRYNLSTASNLGLFVGQRQGGQRCVSGVCRVFPPFEGARLDATLRF